MFFELLLKLILLRTAKRLVDVRELPLLALVINVFLDRATRRRGRYSMSGYSMSGYSMSRYFMSRES